MHGGLTTTVLSHRTREEREVTGKLKLSILKEITEFLSPLFCSLDGTCTYSSLIYKTGVKEGFGLRNLHGSQPLR